MVPLALDVMKEAKSDVKDATARLLQALQATLGTSVLRAAAAKLSSAQQDKLTAILGADGYR